MEMSCSVTTGTNCSKAHELSVGGRCASRRWDGSQLALSCLENFNELIGHSLPLAQWDHRLRQPSLVQQPDEQAESSIANSCIVASRGFRPME